MVILFNKPYGVISQFSPHPTLKTLQEYIPIPYVYPAGRLDADSEGLIILTDNGKLQNEISSPGKEILKTYWVQVENLPEEKDIKKLAAGIKIKDYVTKPAQIKYIDTPILWEREKPIRERESIPTCWLEIKISEGKNRQIRKMTAAINCPTLRLVRIAIGQYSLGNLLPGEFITIGE